MKKHALLRTMLGGLLLVAETGCKSIGPGTVQRDRMHYTTAAANSRKEQLLLNIVKSRFADAPYFLEVASVVSGYSLETGVSLNGQFSPENLRGDSFASAGVSGRYTDRPTISYSPMTGERFARSLLAPIPLEALMFFIQGGTPSDFVLGLTVRSIEGHYNLGLSGGQFEAAEPQFTRLVHSSKEKPAEAFVAVPYEGLWFWIDRRDLPSKTTLATVTLLSDFLEGGSKAGPVLTIPTN